MINCILENDSRASFRHVTVGTITINEKNEVLLVKRAKHLTNGGKYALPGGFVDRDETTKEAALRELKEETGYEGVIKDLFQIIDMPDRPKEDRQNIDFKYIVELTGGQKMDNNEVESIEWISLDNLPPENECAFDHMESVDLYRKYLEKPFPLPVMNWKTL